MTSEWPRTAVTHLFADMPVSLGGLASWLQSSWPDLLVALMWIAVALVTAVALYLVLRSARDWLVKFLRPPDVTIPVWRAVLATVIASTWQLSFVMLAVAVAAAILGLSPEWWRAVVGATLIVQAGLWLASFLREVVARYAEERTTDRSTLSNAMGLVQVLISVAVWSIVALVLLSNLGVDVTALVAGLGIGGIAMGLAAQGIFADLFASLSIILDRPFMRGDFVVFGDYMGKIERIGIKSTRIRSLSGEQIVISNANLLQATIRNYQLLYERRIAFTISVAHGTPAEKARMIPAIMREAVERAPNTRFDRAHLKELAESALIYEVVYFVLDPDYNAYMDIQQAINFAIMDTFAAQDIDFAFPPRTVVLAHAEPPPRQAKDLTRS